MPLLPLTFFTSLQKLPSRSFSDRSRAGVWFVCATLLSACTIRPPSPSELQETRINVVPGIQNTPTNLGNFSPLGTTSDFTSNNTATQSTPNTPALGAPLIVLDSVTTPPKSKNGVSHEIQLLLKNKNWVEALKAIDVEVKKNPRNVQLLFIKSRILIVQGQLEAARLALNSFIEKYPEISEPYNNLAVLYARAGKLTLARENLEMCLKLEANNAACLQNLGDIYILTAAGYYDRAYKINRKMTDANEKRKLSEAIVK